MSNVATVSDNKPDSSDSGPWYEGTHGERIAVRISSLQTNGAYAVVESFAEPRCATPMHLHRNEEEHFIVVSGLYRVATGCAARIRRCALKSQKPKNAGLNLQNRMRFGPSHLRYEDAERTRRPGHLFELEASGRK